MFPLGSVLFPGMPLPLHVFEPRYQALVRDCLANRQEFGVVLIERGFEVGGGDVRFSVGTVAHIAVAEQVGDGRWVVEAIGTHRIRVVSWLPDDPYPLALVEDLPDAPGAADAGQFGAAERAVRRALALKEEMVEPWFPARTQLSEDALVAAWQLAAIAPLGALDQQRLLEVDDPVSRLALLQRLAEEEAEMLAYRLSGG